MAKEAGFPVPPEIAASPEHLSAAGRAEDTMPLQETADGGFIEYSMESGEVRGREIGSDAADGSAVMSAFRQCQASEFGGLARKLLAEVCGTVPNLDSAGTALRNGVHGVAAAGFKAMAGEVRPAAVCTRLRDVRRLDGDARPLRKDVHVPSGQGDRQAQARPLPELRKASWRARAAASSACVPNG